MQEFAAGINTCLYYADFLEHAEELYEKCATGGAVQPQQYLEVLRQLQLSNPDCPMPSDSEVPTSTLTLTPTPTLGRGGSRQQREHQFHPVRAAHIQGHSAPSPS